MATPVSVISTPGDSSTHMLFFLPKGKQQLAMEVHPVVGTQGITAYSDNNAPAGVIVNPGSLSATLRSGVVVLPNPRRTWLPYAYLC